MNLFRHAARQRSPESRALWARYELVYTIVDFGAAFSFVVGSALFFFEPAQTAATWLFVLGSVLFAAKPTIRLVREIKLFRMGDMDDLARRVKS